MEKIQYNQTNKQNETKRFYTYSDIWNADISRNQRGDLERIILPWKALVTQRLKRVNTTEQKWHGQFQIISLKQHG